MRTPTLVTPWKKPRRAAFGAASYGGSVPIPSGYISYTSATQNGSTPIAGWMQGHSVPIGTMLPLTNWGTRGLYRDDSDAKAVPPGIDQYDYMIPIPFIHVEIVTMIAMGAYREESQIQDYIFDLHNRGIGVGPNGMTLMDWANALSMSWYGRRYDELNLTGVPDPMGDYAKRAEVRTAMATMSWSAWMAMQVATTHDMTVQNQAGVTTADVSAGVLGGAAAIASQIAPPVGPIVAAVIGIVAAVVGIVALIIAAGMTGRVNEILANIAVSGQNLNGTDRAAMCAVYTSLKHSNFMPTSQEEAAAYQQAQRTMADAVVDRPVEAALLFENCPKFREDFPHLFATENTDARIQRIAAEQQEANRIEAEMDAQVKAAEERRQTDAAWEAGARRRNATVTKTVGIGAAVATGLTLAKNLLF